MLLVLENELWKEEREIEWGKMSENLGELTGRAEICLHGSIGILRSDFSDI